MFFRHPPPMPAWPGPLPTGAVDQEGRAEPPQEGQQEEQQGGQPISSGAPSPAQQQGIPGGLPPGFLGGLPAGIPGGLPAGFPGGLPAGFLGGQSVGLPAGGQAYLPVLIPVAMPYGWNGGAWPTAQQPAQGGITPQQGSAPQTVPVVAPVDVPEPPAGLRNRTYWFGDTLSSSRRRWTNGPIRSAWSL